MDKEDRRRYFIISSIIIEIVTPLFRNLLSKKYLAAGHSSFQDFLNYQQIVHTLFHLHFTYNCCKDESNCIPRRKLPLYSDAWSQLYNRNTGSTNHHCHCSFSARCITEDELDISLTSLILLNCFGLPESDRKLIVSLREFKNNILSHNSNGKISQEDFDIHWSKLECLVLQLDPRKQNDLHIVSNRPLDEALCSKYHLQLLDVHQKLEEIHEDVQEIKDIVEQIRASGEIIMPEHLSPFRPQDIGRDKFALHCSTELSRINQGYTISDIVMMADGRVVICVHRELLVFDSEGSFIEAIEIQGEPWLITAVNDFTVAIILRCNIIEIYDINNKNRIKTLESLEDKTLKGITTIDPMLLGRGQRGDKLLVSADNQLLIIDRHENRVVHKIDVDCDPCGLHTVGSWIYCNGHYPDNRLYCYNIFGETVFKIYIRSFPRSIVSLQDGSLYVLCCDRSTEHISPDGRKIETVTTSGLMKIFLFSYNTQQKSLATICHNHLKIYREK